MNSITVDPVKYPIGRFSKPIAYDAPSVTKSIESLEALPSKLLAFVQNFSDADWEKHYRPGSWTIRQILNHLVDANVNNYIRFKFALTEESPAIKPYLEDLWSMLPDAAQGDVQPALNLLVAIHAKWVQSLKLMTEEDFRRDFFHPQQNRQVPLYEALAMYTWHSEHHFAHIRLAMIQ